MDECAFMGETESRTIMSINPRDVETARGLLALRCCYEVKPARNVKKDSAELTKSLEQIADNSTGVTDQSSLKIPNSDHEIEWSLKSDRMKVAWELTAASLGYYKYEWNVRGTTPKVAISLEQRIDQSSEQKRIQILIDDENKRKLLEERIKQLTISSEEMET